MAGSSDELTLDEAAERARALDDEFEELKLLRDSPIQHSPFMPRLPGQSGRERRRNRQQLAQLAIAYNELAMGTLKAHPDLSLELLQRALLCAPKGDIAVAKTLSNLGVASLQRGKVQQALRYLRQAVSLDGELDLQSRARGQLNLCAALNMVGQHSAALESAERAVQLLTPSPPPEPRAAAARGAAGGGAGAAGAAHARPSPRSIGGRAAPAAQRRAAEQEQQGSVSAEREAAPPAAEATVPSPASAPAPTDPSSSPRPAAAAAMAMTTTITGTSTGTGGGDGSSGRAAGGDLGVLRAIALHNCCACHEFLGQFSLALLAATRALRAAEAALPPGDPLLSRLRTVAATVEARDLECLQRAGKPALKGDMRGPLSLSQPTPRTRPSARRQVLSDAEAALVAGHIRRRLAIKERRTPQQLVASLTKPTAANRASAAELKYERERKEREISKARALRSRVGSDDPASGPASGQVMSWRAPLVHPASKNCLSHPPRPVCSL